MKVLFVLTLSKIKTEKRNRLYHDRFQYALCFKLDDLYMIRELPGATKLQYWIDRRLETQTRSGQKFYGMLTPEKIRELHAMQNCLLALKQPFKFVVSFTQGDVYTSSLEELEQLYGIVTNGGEYGPEFVNVREAVVSGNPNVIELWNPEYTSRMFFKDRKITDDVKERLKAWVENHADSTNASEGLKSWLNTHSWRSGYAQRYYYIDCKDSSMHTLFAMTFPGLFRKALPIVAKY